MSKLKDILTVEINKKLLKTLNAQKRSEFGKAVALIYERAEKDRYFDGIGGDGRKMQYRYSPEYRRQKAKFVQGKGSLYKYKKNSIVSRYKAEKVNDYARLTGQTLEALSVKVVRVETPLLKKKAKVVLRMFIDDISEASEYSDELQRKIKFFGFAYSKLNLPSRYQRQLDRAVLKFLG